MKSARPSWSSGDIASLRRARASVSTLVETIYNSAVILFTAIGVGIPLTLGGGAGVMPVVTNILFAKAWGKKQAFMAKYWGGATSPLGPLVPTPMTAIYCFQGDLLTIAFSVCALQVMFSGESPCMLSRMAKVFYQSTTYPFYQCSVCEIHIVQLSPLFGRLRVKIVRQMGPSSVVGQVYISSKA